MKTFYISAVVLMCLGACATKPTAPIEVRIPVSTPCVSADVPAPPASYADDALASVTDPVERTQRRAAANLQRKARLAIVEPVLAACR